MAYERRLADLHFDPGPVDGTYDINTMYAVTAVQKLWSAAAHGRIDEQARFVIEHFKYPQPLNPKGPADRVEIDLNKQVLVLWQNYQIRLITTTRRPAAVTTSAVATAVADVPVTPPGVFHFQRFHQGWDHGKLGELYNPYYFNGNWHRGAPGYPEVPAYPASHGCARIPMYISNYFYTLVSKGEEVDVIGTPAGPPPRLRAPAAHHCAGVDHDHRRTRDDGAPHHHDRAPHTTTTPTTHPVTTTTH